MGEVDLGGLFGENLYLAADVVVALLERLEASNGLAAKAEGGRNLGPIELESCASLCRKGAKLAQLFPTTDETERDAPNDRGGKLGAIGYPGKKKNLKHHVKDRN